MQKYAKTLTGSKEASLFALFLSLGIAQAVWFDDQGVAAVAL